MEDEIVIEGIYYDLVVGEPVSQPWAGVPSVFKVVNKEFGVVCEETVSELSGRYYQDHHDKLKARYINEGLAALIGDPETPGEYHG